MKHEQRINAYVAYFAGKLESIIALGDDDETALDDSAIFKRTLVMSFLDALSKIVYGRKNNSHSKRFVTFLEVFCDWGNGTRLSTTHLSRALEMDMDPRLESLRLHVKKRLVGWGKAQKDTSLDEDIQLGEVIKQLPKNYDNKLAGIPVEHLNHFNLLYATRNGLVHEMRELGYGIETESSEQPFYQHAITTGGTSEKDEKWELVYPFDFLVLLARTALANLESYLKRNDLNPDRHFRFGTYFLEEMNPENI